MSAENLCLHYAEIRSKADCTRQNIQKRKINKKDTKLSREPYFLLFLSVKRKSQESVFKENKVLFNTAPGKIYRQKKYCTKMKIPRRRLNLDN